MEHHVLHQSDITKPCNHDLFNIIILLYYSYYQIYNFDRGQSYLILEKSFCSCSYRCSNCVIHNKIGQDIEPTLKNKHPSSSIAIFVFHNSRIFVFHHSSYWIRFIARSKSAGYSHRHYQHATKPHQTHLMG